VKMGAVIAITEAGARRVRPPLPVIRRGVLAPLPQVVVPEDDLTLIQATARGDRAAFKALYERYAPRLGRYVLRLLQRRELVGEVVNDVMLVAWQTAARYDPRASRLSSWLFGIAHNKALKALLRMGARKEDLLGEDGAEDFSAGDGPAPARTPEEAAIGRQSGAALLRAMEGLSPAHRAVIELAFAEGCSYQEIAEITGSPLNTVKTRMFHARKQLARLLEEGSGR